MKFSIVTPSWQQAAFLPECLESVRSQACADVEVEHLVMDGGSVDGTVEILENAKSEMQKAQCRDFTFDYVSGPDRGQTDAINRGMARATGDVLAYLCSDDTYEPDALRRVADCFRANPEADFVYGDFYFLEGDSGWRRRKRAGDYSVERLERVNFLGQPAVFWKRSVWERFGSLDETLRYCMDHEYWLRVRGRTRWVYLPEVLASARLHAGSKTCSQLVAMWEEAARMGERYGVGGRLRRDATRMRRGGQIYYAAKRWFFRNLGRLRVRKGRDR